MGCIQFRWSNRLVERQNRYLRRQLAEKSLTILERMNCNMKKCFGVLVLTLLFFGSCQQGIRSPSEATTTETSLETSETAPFTITEVIPETTNVIRESTNEYPHWRVEHEQYISHEVKGNMAIIQ